MATDTEQQEATARFSILYRRPFSDVYVGFAEHLLSLGVVKPHELPGAPGNGNAVTTFAPDGRVTRQNLADFGLPGSKVVQRVGRCIKVAVTLSSDEARARCAWLQDLNLPLDERMRAALIDASVTKEHLQLRFPDSFVTSRQLF